MSTGDLRTLQTGSRGANRSTLNYDSTSESEADAEIARKEYLRLKRKEKSLLNRSIERSIIDSASEQNLINLSGRDTALTEPKYGEMEIEQLKLSAFDIDPTSRQLEDFLAPTYIDTYKGRGQR